MTQLIFYLFLPIIFYIGIKTSFNDYKSFKIKNKDLILSLIIGILTYITIFIYFTITKTYFNYIEFFKLSGINILITIIIAIGMWLNKLWNAADAKLIIIYSIITPIIFYEIPLIKYFPTFSIIIHTFIIVIIVMVFQIIIKGKYLDYKSSLLETISKNNFTYKIFGTIFIIHWILNIIYQYTNFNYFIIITLSMFLFLGTYIAKIFEKHKNLLLILIILRIIIDESIYSINFIYQIIFIILVFIGLILFEKIPDKIFTASIKIKNLKNGMILKYPICKKNSTYFQLTPKKASEIFKVQTKKNITTEINIIIENNIRGLNIKDTERIKKLINKKLLTEKIEIQEHTCFAPYLFLGTLITIITKGNLIYWIKLLISIIF